MSETIIDMPKVAQMLDAGWHVLITKNVMGSYSVQATHWNAMLKRKALDGIAAQLRAIPGAFPFEDDDHTHGEAIITDDFTPEQALTRMAYKVHGELL